MSTDDTKMIATSTAKGTLYVRARYVNFEVHNILAVSLRSGAEQYC